MNEFEDLNYSKCMETQTNQTNNAAKFAFFYMLSLVALIFMALSTGMIIFQIINKHIADILNEYSGRYSDNAMKFAISALVISAPIFFFTMWQICKSLFSGVLEKDSGVRRWLTYFILLVSSVVMIGWLIATLNGFLNGELSTKFLLKAITAIGIAAAIFTFYFYDIKRDEVKEKKDKVVNIYFYASLVIVVAVFAASLFTVESPTETRSRKFDNMILDNFSQIDSAINEYYRGNEKLPENLEILKEEYSYIDEKDTKDPVSGEQYGYNKLEDDKYELCAIFRTSNKNDNTADYNYKEQWPHDAGEQCLSKRVWEKEIINEPMR
ncbi:hypothetical protein DRH27_01780 [Candidatus Falkowbacteria bacterium]|nr:MAG: hypothetical protein DRH27_01780 [Candidatus Falkowbacteria bacterium]